MFLLCALAAAMGIFMAILLIASAYTLLDWIDPVGRPRTLVAVIADEWRWFVGLLHRIW
jgi:hypothetical protein